MDRCIIHTRKSTRTRNSWLRFASLHNFSQPLLSLLFGRYSSFLSLLAFYTLLAYTLFMKCIFVESKIFEKYRDDHLSDEEFRLFQAELMSNPKQGDVIQGTGGLRKVRVASKGKGKRGGSRIIYYFLDEKRRFYLLTIYGKSEMSDLTADQKKQLKSFMEVWRNEQS
jgi:mRNA-degrading endonuclease RelE of RelBE toxin-antitoxin system